MYKKVCILSKKKQRDKQSAGRTREQAHHERASVPQDAA